MSGTKLKGANEENVLIALVWHEACCQELAFRVAPELFSSRHYREIAEPTLKFIEQFGKPPRGHLMDLLEDKVRRGDDHSILLRRIIEQMEATQAELNVSY